MSGQSPRHFVVGSARITAILRECETPIHQVSMAVYGAPAVLVAAFNTAGSKIYFRQNLAVNTRRGTGRTLSVLFSDRSRFSPRLVPEGSP
jgi:hypothetical protein